MRDTLNRVDESVLLRTAGVARPIQLLCCPNSDENVLITFPYTFRDDTTSVSDARD